MASQGRNIFLTGISGSGKSTVGRKLAQTLNVKFYDTDSLIESKEKMSVAEIFQMNGERYFRRVEQDILREIIKKKHSKQSQGRVVALGGGALVSPETRRLVNVCGELVYLKVSCAIAAARLGRSHNRPLLMTQSNQRLSITAVTKRLRDQLRARLPHYKKAAISVSTSQKGAQVISKEIIRRLNLGNCKF